MSGPICGIIIHVSSPQLSFFIDVFLQLLHLYLSFTPADVVCARMWLCYGNGILTFDAVTGRPALANTTHLIDKFPLPAADLARLKVSGLIFFFNKVANMHLWRKSFLSAQNLIEIIEILNEPTAASPFSKALAGHFLGSLGQNIPQEIKGQK